MEAGSLHRPAEQVVGILGRGQPTGLLCETRCCGRRSARPRQLRRLFQLGRDRGVHALGRKSEMRRPLLGSDDDLGEASVQFAPPGRPNRRVGSRSEEGVREPNAVVLDLDHLCLDGRVHGARIGTSDGGDDSNRRVGQRRRDLDDFEGLVGQVPIGVRPPGR